MCELWRFIRTSVRNPRWFADVVCVGIDTLRGRNNWESHENGLKLAARRHDVDYHRFYE